MEKEKKIENGIRRTVWLSRDLDAKVEQARQKLGLGRSGFYRYAVVEVVKELLCQGPKENH
jgi:hypothetical protein